LIDLLDQQRPRFLNELSRYTAVKAFGFNRMLDVHIFEFGDNIDELRPAGLKQFFDRATWRHR
jgi:hypothetical protein